MEKVEIVNSTHRRRVWNSPRCRGALHSAPGDAPNPLCRRNFTRDLVRNLDMLHRSMAGAFAVCLLGCLAAAAQQPMTVAKLTSFIESSQALKYPDAQVAEVLKACRMTERLDLATIEKLQYLGAGPKT